MINNKKGQTKPNPFSKYNMYSAKDGAKRISFSDGSKSNKDGSAKTTGYIPNTPANRAKLTALLGKPERYGDRLMWC